MTFVPAPPNKAKTPNADGPISGIALNTVVMYENQGNSLLALVLDFKQNKYQLLNEKGQKTDLAGNRLYVFTESFKHRTGSDSERSCALAALRQEAEAASSAIAIADLWSVVQEEDREYSGSELSELYFGSLSLEQHLALWLALKADPVYFKRKQNSFQPRSAEAVSELQKSVAVRAERERLQHLALQNFRARIQGQTPAWPPELNEPLELLADLAASTRELDANRLKDAKQFLTLCLDNLNLNFSGSPDRQAYMLLNKIAYFDEFTNLSITRFNLKRPYGQAADREVQTLLALDPNSNLERFGPRLDLSNLASFTIDDASTSDMDDAFSVEQTPEGYRIGIHISDVSALISPASDLDRMASRRATSHYFPDQTIHMLPPTLASDLCSLKEASLRPTLSCLIETDTDLNIRRHEIQATLIKSQRRLSYEATDQSLETGGGDLGVLYQLASNLEMQRLDRGAIKVPKREVIVQVLPDRSLSLKEIDENSPSHLLVSELMILANQLFADFSFKNKLPVIYRVQSAVSEELPVSDSADTPAGPAKDYAARVQLSPTQITALPGPHVALGLERYIQATSPIRRYHDLVNVRQIVGYLQNGQVTYNRTEIEDLIQATDDPLRQAQQVRKESRRFWLLKYLEQRLAKNPNAAGRSINATVLRCDGRLPLLELDEIFLPSLVRLKRPVKVGDLVKLRISALNAAFDELKLEEETRTP